MDGLIHNEINERLDRIVQKFFWLNRVSDAGMSVLANEFTLHRFEEKFHPIAHLYPLLADRVSEIQKTYNMVTTYHETPLGKKDFVSPLEFFEYNLTEHLAVQKYIADTVMMIRQGGINDTYGTHSLVASALGKLLRIFAPYVSQALLLVDKATSYGEVSFAVQMFDENCNHFIIIDSEQDVPSLFD